MLREPTASEPSWSVLLSDAATLSVLSVVGWLLESLVHVRRQVDRLAKTEPLTGLLNRNAFFRRLEVELTRSRREGRSLALAYLDCDHFKAWNDSHGHRAGDELLQTVAETLCSATRSSDLVARLGGDEFALLFPDILPDDAQRVVRRLHDELRRNISDGDRHVTVSIGLAVFDRPPESTTEVMDLADRLMYEAKSAGKDRIVSHVPSGSP